MQITSRKNGRVLDLGVVSCEVTKKEFKEMVFSKFEREEADYYAGLDFHLILHDGIEDVYVDSLGDEEKILLGNNLTRFSNVAYEFRCITVLYKDLIDLIDDSN